MNDDADVLFTTVESARFRADLAHVDNELRSLAHEFKCKYFSTAGRGWPGRRITRRLWLRTYELKLILNPNYLQDHRVHYELREQWMYDFGEILTKLLSHRLLASIAPEQLSDTASIELLARKHLASVLRNGGGQT